MDWLFLDANVPFSAARAPDARLLKWACARVRHCAGSPRSHDVVLQFSSRTVNCQVILISLDRINTKMVPRAGRDVPGSFAIEGRFLSYHRLYASAAVVSRDAR